MMARMMLVSRFTDKKAETCMTNAVDISQKAKCVVLPGFWMSQGMSERKGYATAA
jgi:hypothetical protein